MGRLPMYASVPARFRSMRLVLITITKTGARVVAACEPDPGSFQNTFLQPQTTVGLLVRTCAHLSFQTLRVPTSLSTSRTCTFAPASALSYRSELIRPPVSAFRPLCHHLGLFQP